MVPVVAAVPAIGDIHATAAWNPLDVSESMPDFIPAVRLRRTERERRDQHASWERTDEAFFAAGACHVLAFTLLARHPRHGRAAVLLRPVGGLPGSHVYVRCGRWAFDFNGWTAETDFLAANMAECLKIWPAWDYERVDIAESIENVCATWNLRPPSNFAGDAIARANAYLDRFPSDPPAT